MEGDKNRLFRYENFGIYNTLEGGRWRVEGGFPLPNPLPTFNFPLSRKKEGVGYDYRSSS
jgi:hypothetical protein